MVRTLARVISVQPGWSCPTWRQAARVGQTGGWRRSVNWEAVGG